MTTENIDRSTRKARIAAAVYRETQNAITGLRRSVSNLANTFLVGNIASFLFAGGITAMLLSMASLSNVAAGLNADLHSIANAILEKLYPALQKFLELPPAVQAGILGALSMATVFRGPLAGALSGFVAGPGRGLTRYFSRLGRFFRLSAGRSGIFKAAIKTLSVALLTLPGVGKLAAVAIVGVGAVAVALSAPVWLVVAAVAALAAMLVLAWTKSERFRDAVKGVIADITKYAIDFVNEILRIAWGFRQWLKDIGAWEAGINAGARALEWIGNMAKWTGDRIADLIELIRKFSLPPELKTLVKLGNPITAVLGVNDIARGITGTGVLPDFSNYGGTAAGAGVAPQLSYPSYVVNNSTTNIGIGEAAQRRIAHEENLNPNHRSQIQRGGF